MVIELNMQKSKPLPHPRHIKKAGKGEFILRCGKCGHTGFAVHVMPANGSPKAFVTALVCARCLTHRNVDELGLIEGEGKVTFSPKRDGGAVVRTPEIYGDVK